MYEIGRPLFLAFKNLLSYFKRFLTSPHTGLPANMKWLGRLIRSQHGGAPNDDMIFLARHCTLSKRLLCISGHDHTNTLQVVAADRPRNIT